MIVLNAARPIISLHGCPLWQCFGQPRQCGSPFQTADRKRRSDHHYPPEMKRYFMTIPEAVHLVLQASAMSWVEKLCLNMGEQVKIQDLAEDLIRLSGLEPNKDIEIIYTGIRPGEKLSEDLWDQGFAYSHTKHPDINQVDSEEALRTKNSTPFG